MSEQPPSTAAAPLQEASTAGETIDDFYKGKGKGSHDGCYNCGSRWRHAADCPMKDDRGGGKGKGKGKSSGYCRGPPFRPSWKGKGFRKGKFGGKGKGRYGKGFKGGGKNKGYNSCYVNPVSSRPQGLNVTDGAPTILLASTSNTEQYNIASSSDEDFMNIKHSSIRVWRKQRSQARPCRPATTR